jgi:hypothetical protein
MMVHPRSRIVRASRAVVLCAAITGCSTLSLSLPAVATVTTTAEGQRTARVQRMATVKARAADAVRQRVEDLGNAKASLAASPTVTPAHRSALNVEIDAQVSGLARQGTAVQDATDVPTVVAQARKIVDDYRVYVLELPKVAEIEAIDAVTASMATVDRLLAQESAVLDALQAGGKDVSAQRRTLQTSKQKVDSVRASVEPLADPVLALTPSGYPANRTTLQSTRTALRAAVQALKTMKDDLRGVLDWSTGTK